MDLAQLIQSRRTVHSSTPKKVSEATVKHALELSLWAPNHKLTFPWAYFWVGDTARRSLADLAVEMKNAEGAKRKAIHDGVMQYAHLIVLALKRSEDKRLHEDYATLACSVQIASLVLWQDGIGTKWSTGKWTRADETYKILKISPEEYVLEGALMIGIPPAIPPAPARPKLAEFLHRVE